LVKLFRVYSNDNLETKSCDVNLASCLKVALKYLCQSMVLVRYVINIIYYNYL